MAKAVQKKAAPAAKPGKQVAAPSSKALKTADVDVMLLMEHDAGRGVSTAAEDNIIPLIYKLHTSSPQVLKQKSEYIKGAVAGNIWPRGSKTLIDGEETGLPFIPVAFKKWWMEWGAERGEGFFGRHPYDAADENKGRPADASYVEDPKKAGGGVWVRENGHVLIETREHAGLAFINDQWTGSVVSMASTDHGASRTWMGLMKDKRIPKVENGKIVGYTDKRAPCFAYVYNIKTVAKSNDKGDWHGWAVEDGMGDGEITFVPIDVEGGGPLYLLARQLADDFESGVKQTEAPVDVGDGPSDDDSNF